MTEGSVPARNLTLLSSDASLLSLLLLCLIACDCVSTERRLTGTRDAPNASDQRRHKATRYGEQESCEEIRKRVDPRGRWKYITVYAFSIENLSEIRLREIQWIQRRRTLMGWSWKKVSSMHMIFAYVLWVKRQDVAVSKSITSYMVVPVFLLKLIGLIKIKAARDNEKRGMGTYVVREDGLQSSKCVLLIAVCYTSTWLIIWHRYFIVVCQSRLIRTSGETRLSSPSLAKCIDSNFWGDPSEQLPTLADYKLHTVFPCTVAI
uniref:Cis-prenyltransferase n=1 Tax=Ginkgo biloba TaxID=3311 RepID=G1EJ42_GINBI|nr:cis-prenyltransferase [Ginkgo biloba]